ncbi:MAG: ATP-binding protein, partial [Pseudomonadota bacterium]
MAAQPDRARPGMISVSAHTDENAAVICVQDDGPGLPDRVRERLFEPFSGTTRKGGSGLGLSIARELARANGGDVSLAHTSTTGAVFQVCLPLAQGVV